MCCMPAACHWQNWLVVIHSDVRPAGCFPLVSLQMSKGCPFPIVFLGTFFAASPSSSSSTSSSANIQRPNGPFYQLLIRIFSSPSLHLSFANTGQKACKVNSSQQQVGYNQDQSTTSKSFVLSSYLIIKVNKKKSMTLSTIDRSIHRK